MGRRDNRSEQGRVAVRREGLSLRRIIGALLIVGVGGVIGLVPISTSTAYARSTGGGKTSNGWSGPVSFDAGNLPGSVSCATTNFCVAVDNPGNALTFNGSSWSSQSINDNENLFSVSCPLSDFCAAVGNFLAGGDANIYNGSWQGIDTIAEGTVGDVSCSSGNFCVAQAAGQVSYAYDGESWTGHQNNVAPGSISCPSDGFCVGTDGGYADYYSGDSWTQNPTLIDSNQNLGSISCPTAGFCVAVDGNGNALTYTNGSWSVPEFIDANQDLNAVSCATTTFCVAVDNDGYALTYDNGAWSAPVSIDSPDNGLGSVSCPTETFCEAVDYAGNSFTYSAPAPPAPLTIATTSLSLGTVGSFYSDQLAASGGTAPYKWKKLSTLPKGLKLSSTGLLSGIPSAKKVAPGTYPISVQVTDSGKKTSKQTANATLNLSLT